MLPLVFDGASPRLPLRAVRDLDTGQNHVLIECRGLRRLPEESSSTGRAIAYPALHSIRAAGRCCPGRQQGSGGQAARSARQPAARARTVFFRGRSAFEMPGPSDICPTDEAVETQGTWTLRVA